MLSENIFCYKATAITSPKIFRLPYELLAMICQNLDNFDDMFCYCLAERRLLLAGFKTMVKFQCRGPIHAGHRVIAASNETLDDDYPSSVSSSIAEAYQSRTSAEDEVDPADSSAQWYSMMCGYPREPSLVESLYMQRHLKYRVRHENRRHPKLQDVLECLWGTPWGACAKAEFRKRLVLCNLSKKQYVCESAIDDLASEHPQKSTIVPPNLVHAMLLRVFWTSYPTNDIQRGAWAGDRFEVISSKMLQEKSDLDQWSDVTEDSVRLLRRIWELPEKNPKAAQKELSKKTA